MLHKKTLLGGKLKELIGVARSINKEGRKINREADQEIHRLKNRAYRELPPLWQEYLRDYRSYYEDTVLVETQRMADVYALWVVCEMANGLGLRSHSKSLREFRSPRKESILRYDAPGTVRDGWGDSIMGALFPSEEDTVVATGSGQPEIFLNYRGVNIYFECKYDLRQTAEVWSAVSPWSAKVHPPSLKACDTSAYAQGIAPRCADVKLLRQL